LLAGEKKLLKIKDVKYVE